MKLSNDGQLVTVVPKDAVRRSVFIAEVSLWVEIDIGRILELTFNSKSKEVKVRICKDGDISQANVKWTQMSKASGHEMKPKSNSPEHRLGGLVVDVTNPAVVRFVPS